MPEDDPVDPRLLTDRNGDRIQQLEEELSDLRGRLDSFSGTKTAAQPDLGLINQNIALLASRASALEAFNKGLQGQDGISVQGNIILLDRKDPRGEITVPSGIGLDLKVYDTDGITVLHDGGTLTIQVDDATPTPATKEVAWYKIDWCEGTTPKTRFILSTPAEDLPP